MTNDVEEVSIVNNNLNRITAENVSKKGIPKLLDLYSKFDVEGTFYFTGTFAKSYPESVQLVMDHGHEIGCHGYSHHTSHAFDVLSTQKQYLHLSSSKKIIEEIAGKIESFRAPALRLGYNTPLLLEKLGFKTDSSVASQRFDGPMTFGSLQKLNWLSSPRMPYHMDSQNPYRRGRSRILEIPPSALLLSYQGTTMRVSPKLNNLIGNYLFKESKRINKPIVFIFHPVELLNEKQSQKIKSRSKSFLSSFFGDKLRTKLKSRNLGRKAEDLLKNVLKKSVDEGFEFCSVKRYSKKFYSE